MNPTAERTGGYQQDSRGGKREGSRAKAEKMKGAHSPIIDAMRGSVFRVVSGHRGSLGTPLLKIVLRNPIRYCIHPTDSVCLEKRAPQTIEN